MSLLTHLDILDLIADGVIEGADPAHASYAARGQYNGDTTVTPSKGLR